MPAPYRLSRALPLVGADVAMRWQGELHAAGFFPAPASVTLGPAGHFAIPPELLDDRPQDGAPGPGPQRAVLLQPHGHGFALRLDLPQAVGRVITATQTFDLADLRAGRVPFVTGPVLPLGVDTRVELKLGDFTFIVRVALVPEKPRWRPRLTTDVRNLLVCLVLAAAILGGPLLLGHPAQRPEPLLGEYGTPAMMPIEVQVELPQALPR